MSWFGFYICVHGCMYSHYHMHVTHIHTHQSRYNTTGTYMKEKNPKWATEELQPRMSSSLCMQTHTCEHVHTHKITDHSTNRVAFHRCREVPSQAPHGVVFVESKWVAVFLAILASFFEGSGASQINFCLALHLGGLSGGQRQPSS